jgi:hypothetical protein
LCVAAIPVKTIGTWLNGPRLQPCVAEDISPCPISVNRCEQQGRERKVTRSIGSGYGCGYGYDGQMSDPQGMPLTGNAPWGWGTTGHAANRPVCRFRSFPPSQSYIFYVYSINGSCHNLSFQYWYTSLRIGRDTSSCGLNHFFYFFLPVAVLRGRGETASSLFSSHAPFPVPAVSAQYSPLVLLIMCTRSHSRSFARCPAHPPSYSNERATHISPSYQQPAAAAVVRRR